MRAKGFLTAVLILCLLGFFGYYSPCQDSAPGDLRAELKDARRHAWMVVQLIHEMLEERDTRNFPGMRDWLQDFTKQTPGIDAELDPDRRPVLDIDRLVTHNPNFWRAYYEVAPADPGLLLLHSALLLSAGEAARAMYLIVVAEQRPGIPAAFLDVFNGFLSRSHRMIGIGKKRVAQGTQKFDKGDYPGAIKIFRSVQSDWPQCSLAYYETGLTLFQQARVASGQKPEPMGSISVNSGEKIPADVKAAFAEARRHNPFDVLTYQGDDPELIENLITLGKEGWPDLQKLAENLPKRSEDELLMKLAVSCQKAGYHELALAVRQVLVARRACYKPQDHQFLAESLRKIAPGSTTEETLKAVSADPLNLMLLVKPEPTVP